MKKIKIICIGNISAGDDAAGHKIYEILRQKKSLGAEVFNLDTSSIDLINELEGAKKVIIVDAVNSNISPGKIIKLTLEDILKKDSKTVDSVHDFDLVHTLQLAEKIINNLPKIIIVGITIKNIHQDYDNISEPVKESIEKAVKIIIEETKHS
ncbi:hydrogenase maturation protease [Candidatus Woesearchaeota archaeon]|nr:hydrogenase maturation protease [Candidatus Woesearchaeota archaeon]